MRDALRLALDRQEDVKPVGVRCTTAKLCNPWPGPVSPYTVARELGHGGEAMVRRGYGHLGTVRHRSEVLEYRVEQHAERLADRVKRLR